MLKPPAANIPGMTDTLDFVKNLWGSMNIPGASIPGMQTLSGMAAPPMSVEDLDKRIADLKAVEAWLNINLTMLRGTIHTMEVQRNTLTALKSMGASMAEAMRQSGVSTDKMANMPFAPFFGQAASAGAAAPAPSAPADTRAQPGAGASAAGATPEGTTPPLALPAAMAWWNQLQEQFTQAVATAMTPPPSPAPSEAGKQDAPAANAPAPSDTNGKPRGSRSRSDKT
jgi:hypothetical protein